MVEISDIWWILVTVLGKLSEDTGLKWKIVVDSDNLLKLMTDGGN